MQNGIDGLISEYFAEYGAKGKRDSHLAELFVALVQHCPDQLARADQLDVASAVAMLRRAVGISRSEIASLAGVDEAELSQWEVGVARRFGLTVVVGKVLGSLLQKVGASPRDERPSQHALIPGAAMARGASLNLGEDRDAVLGAIGQAKIRAQFGGKFRAISLQKCNWYRHASHRADGVLAEYMALRSLGTPPVPVPVDLVAEIHLGLRYYLGHLGAEFSGWMDPDRSLICINADEPRTRQRYTFAHEIGHAVMHADDLRGAVHRDTPGAIDEAQVELTLDVLRALTANDLICARGEEREMRRRANRETEANVFAAALLMPSGVLLSLIKRGVTGTRALAKQFEVSVPAMEWRLRFLDACLGMPEAPSESRGQGSLDFGG